MSVPQPMWQNFTCSFCSESFNDFTKLRRHRKVCKMSPPAFDCYYAGCSYKSKAKFNVLRHIDLHHKHKNIAPEQLACKHCHKMYAGGRCKLRNHERICGSRPTGEGEEEHRTHNRITCPAVDCEHGVHTMEELAEHFAATHDGDCVTHGQKFESERDLNTFLNKLAESACSGWCRRPNKSRSTLYRCNRGGREVTTQRSGSKKMNKICTSFVRATKADNGSYSTVYCDYHVHDVAADARPTTGATPDDDEPQAAVQRPSLEAITWKNELEQFSVDIGAVKEMLDAGEFDDGDEFRAKMKEAAEAIKALQERAACRRK